MNCIDVDGNDSSSSSSSSNGFCCNGLGGSDSVGGSRDGSDELYFTAVSKRCATVRWEHNHNEYKTNIKL
ncbi:Hypothetical predicted protein [Octopus vulgaris]|uniref:Uncharacterized protein n=1 Tax=Octopus vulgaris TaxID=6645 RepID=A0AA36B7I8_OCTVU|nr:Hypothetical predicted protein [Octopus vulgaris]